MKILRPMAMSITPPRMPALPASFVPNLRPKIRPAQQIKNVTIAIVITEEIASVRLYSEIVKPTERASIDVATPWIKSAENVSLLHPHSSHLHRMPSISIFPPM